MQRAFCIEWNYREFEKICREGSNAKRIADVQGKVKM